MVTRPASPVGPIRLAVAAATALTLAGCGVSGPFGDSGDSNGATDSSASSPATPDSPQSPESPATPDGKGSGAAGGKASGGSGGKLGPEARALGLRTGWGPTAAELDRAARIVGRMSLAELAGATLVLRWTGTEAPTALVREIAPGGVIAFSENVASADQIRGVNQAVQQAADRSWPVLTGVDQEGGLVQRLGPDIVTDYPPFMAYGAADRPRLTRQAHRALGVRLRELGFSVDFAPVLDVTTGPDDPTIGARSAGSRPATATRQGIAAFDGFAQAGVLGTGKHFPGHGSVTADSHEELPTQDATLSELRERDLIPFRRAIRAGVPGIMVAHLNLTKVAPGVPSSLSERVVTGLLREELGFDGLAVTDGMDMGAITDSYDAGEAAVRAIDAGQDVVLTPADAAGARDGLVAAVQDGSLSRKRLQQAAARVVATALRSERRAPARGKAVGTDEAAAAVARAAITQVEGTCGRRLIGDGVAATGDPEAVAAFEAAARRAGVSTAGRTTVALAGDEASVPSADVAVATTTPYVLGRASAPVRIATFGANPAAMDALVRVLQGARAPGTLPVEVDGVSRRGCGG